MRVDDPMLSMVATLRRADRRSGAKAPRARQAPLNSSISAMKPRISGVILRVVGWIMTPNITPNYTQFVQHPKTNPFTPIIETLQPQPSGCGHLKVAVCRSSTPRSSNDAIGLAEQAIVESEIFTRGNNVAFRSRLWASDMDP